MVPGGIDVKMDSPPAAAIIPFEQRATDRNTDGINPCREGKPGAGPHIQICSRIDLHRRVRAVEKKRLPDPARRIRENALLLAVIPSDTIPSIAVRSPIADRAG